MHGVGIASDGQGIHVDVHQDGVRQGSADLDIAHEAGTGGPGGGVRTGVLITKDNMLHWYGGEWGLWGWDKTSVDRAANSGVVWSWGIWNNGDSMDKAIKQANAVSFLASDRASYISGHVLGVDGCASI